MVYDVLIAHRFYPPGLALRLHALVGLETTLWVLGHFSAEASIVLGLRFAINIGAPARVLRIIGSEGG